MSQNFERANAVKDLTGSNGRLIFHRTGLGVFAYVHDTDGLQHMTDRTADLVLEYWCGLATLQETIDQLDLTALVSVFEELAGTPIPIECSRNEAVHFARCALESV
jgi:hypothetical protein